MTDIRPLVEDHIAGFHATFDSVAREKLYLGRTQAPPIEETRKYVQDGLLGGRPQFVALVDGMVVGWCDVARKMPDTMTHSGILGMGIVKEHRGKGIGKALMEATLRNAKAQGLTRIELTVRVDNERAKKLYDAFGFVVEGTLRKFMLVDGTYHDSYLMALVER